MHPLCSHVIQSDTPPPMPWQCSLWTETQDGITAISLPQILLSYCLLSQGVGLDVIRGWCDSRSPQRLQRSQLLEQSVESRDWVVKSSQRSHKKFRIYVLCQRLWTPLRQIISFVTFKAISDWRLEKLDSEVLEICF